MAQDACQVGKRKPLRLTSQKDLTSVPVPTVIAVREGVKMLTHRRNLGNALTLTVVRRLVMSDNKES